VILPLFIGEVTPKCPESFAIFSEIFSVKIEVLANWAIGMVFDISRTSISMINTVKIKAFPLNRAVSTNPNTCWATLSVKVTVPIEPPFTKRTIGIFPC
jgi:hypothetical protein